MRVVSSLGSPRTRPPVSWAGATLFAIPILVLVSSYAWLALDRRQALLWHVVVHEGGKYTLAETIVYYRHFLRELPIDLSMAIFLLAGYGTTRSPPSFGVMVRRRALALTATGLATTVLLVGLSTRQVASELGWEEVLRELLQYRTRDDLAGYGSHWHFHWLSTVWFGAASVICAPLVARLLRPRAEALAGGRDARFLLSSAWLYVVALTIIFGLSPESFVSPRYTGHQAREILTHGTVTLLLGFGVLHASGAWLSSGEFGEKRETPRFPRVVLQVCVPLFLLIPVFLAVAALSQDVMTVGQSGTGLAPTVAGHFFEHPLDYGFVSLVLIAGQGVRYAYHSRRANIVSQVRA